MNNFGFRQYDLPTDGFICMVDELPVCDVGNSSDSVFDLIFSVDPLTGLPCDVVQQYLSDKTSADVKEFIERTFKGFSIDDPSIAPEEVRKEYSALSDSLVADLSRNRFESVEQYEQPKTQNNTNEKAEKYRDKILKELKEKNRE